MRRPPVSIRISLKERGGRGQVSVLSPNLIPKNGRILGLPKRQAGSPVLYRRQDAINEDVSVWASEFLAFFQWVDVTLLCHEVVRGPQLFGWCARHHSVDDRHQFVETSPVCSRFFRGNHKDMNEGVHLL